MRAFRVLEALSHRYSVSLLVAGIHGRAANGSASEISTVCDDVTSLPGGSGGGLRNLGRRFLLRLSPRAYHAVSPHPSDWYLLGAARRRLVSGAYAGERFDRVHLFRLYMHPVLRSLPEPLTSVPWQIDLDDIESTTRRRIAEVARRNGDGRIAETARRDADKYGLIERRVLESFSRVFVCSDVDRERLSGIVRRPSVDVLPNVVSIPAAPAPDPGSTPFVFLFVGSLNYYPNLDAVTFFCRDVAPRIRRRTRRRFRIRIVADGRRRAWRRVSGIPEVERVEAPDRLAREYGAAHVAVVPVRAGGGTRIKALEAFSFRKPVVATTLGLEGIDARHEEHALMGETADELATHCLRLMHEPDLRRHLGESGFRLVTSAHRPDVLAKRLDGIVGREGRAE